ncbi:MAG: tetratricopeptide repeat protein, partial [Acidobacteriota bacterium]
FEATRTDAEPHVEALQVASVHAHHACRLDPDLAEAWATLGFILERTGERDDALSALTGSVALEPDNWLHLVRLAAASWGQRRIDAARRALAECPQLPVAHWLAASVYVARGTLDKAGHEVHAGLEMIAAEARGSARFSTVAFHWMAGLLCLAREAPDDAVAAFDRELALEARGHLYARECAANTWYAKGACLLRLGHRDAARAAFGEAISRVPLHPMAHAGLAIANHTTDTVLTGAPLSVDHAFAGAALLVGRGDARAAAGLIEAALATAPPGSAGWLLPIEPLIHVGHAPEAWRPALAALHLRAR